MNLVRTLLLKIYSTAVFLSARILSCIPAQSLKKKWHLAERMSLPASRQKSVSGSCTWIHAASLGEAKVLVRFLELIEKSDKRSFFILTAVTTTGVEYIQAHCTGRLIAAG